jgi:hypothetical protein
VLFCHGAPKPRLLLSYQQKILTVKVSMFHLQSIKITKITSITKILRKSGIFPDFFFLDVASDFLFQITCISHKN